MMRARLTVDEYIPLSFTNLVIIGSYAKNEETSRCNALPKSVAPAMQNDVPSNKE
jgi:hypothetical protein